MKFDLSSYIKKYILNASAYIVGKQLDYKKYIKLNANENVFPPPKCVIDDIKKSLDSGINLYPDSDEGLVKDRIAKYLGVSNNMIILENGSAALLSLIIRATLGEGDTLTVVSPTFDLYKGLALMQGAKINEIKWDYKKKFPLDDVIHSESKIVIIPNPNAPTGISMAMKDIEYMIKNCKKIFVLDEAYTEFSDENGLHLLKKYKNLIITRTFSKAYALAGLRVGMGIASKEIIDQLNKLKMPYNMSQLSQASILSCISNVEKYKDDIASIKQERDIAISKFQERGFYVTDSSTNFVLIEMPEDGISAAEFVKKLEKKDVLIRKIDSLINCARVTIGNKEQMCKLFDVIDNMLYKKTK